jgi:signal transduction histidine kinase
MQEKMNHAEHRKSPPSTDIPLDEVRNQRRRAILQKNTCIAAFGYMLPLTAYFIARTFDLATYTYGDLLITSSWILISQSVIYTIISWKRQITVRFVNITTFGELTNWIGIYIHLVSYLNEIRPSALLAAYLGIIFLLPNTGFIPSLLLSLSVVISYTCISYYQITFGHQAGIFAIELVYVCFFFFSSLYVAFAAGMFKKQREEVLRAKQRAESASKAKSEFLANMSHELRTPLNHIMGFTELIAGRNVGEINAVQEEYLNDVISSSRHLLSLINDILDLAKVEAGKMALERSPVKIRDLLAGSLIMVKERALKHGIRLSLEADGFPEIIQVDERKIKQVVYNLISNAMKFTPNGGEIRVGMKFLSTPLREDPYGEVRESGQTISIWVSDTGIGIEKKNLERIFDPFEQVENGATRKHPGTGLGLSLTRNFVELHGGTIWAESEGEGKGSTFHFTIPVLP